MLQHTDIEFLYAFTSHGYWLIEVKRNDLPANSPPSELYYWLLIERDVESIERLEFRAQSQDDDLEIREFNQGVLSFDNEFGEYIRRDETGLAMDRIAKGQIPKAIKVMCHTYLQTAAGGDI